MLLSFPWFSVGEGWNLVGGRCRGFIYHQSATTLPCSLHAEVQLQMLPLFPYSCYPVSQGFQLVGLEWFTCVRIDSILGASRQRFLPFAVNNPSHGCAIHKVSFSTGALTLPCPMCSSLLTLVTSTSPPPGPQTPGDWEPPAPHSLVTSEGEGLEFTMKPMLSASLLQRPVGCRPTHEPSPSISVCMSQRRQNYTLEWEPTLRFC